MKLRILAVLALVLPLVTGCDTNEQPQTTTSQSVVSLQINGITTKTKAVGVGGEEFFVRLSSASQWQAKLIPAEASSWVQYSRSSGEETKDLGIVLKIGANSGQSRIASFVVVSQGMGDTIRISQTGSSQPNPSPVPQPPVDNGNGQTTPTTPPNSNDPVASGEHILGDMNRLEIPRLAGGANNYFISHRLSDGSVNYSVEFDTQRYHSRWVAFTFDATNSAKNTNRSNAWMWDPQVPSEFSTEKMFSGSGYSRGHMVASSDRYITQQANEQTFYYTNMSPQKQAHNEGVWGRLEQQVQAWGRNRSFCDVLYVAKGGTIADGQIEETRLQNKLVIPKYYWMALVTKKDGVYHGIAFWTEHRPYAKGIGLKTLSISIDELEQKTGLDLFHNFEDSIEQTIEAETSTSYNWSGLN